jgi:opacity protein-like surface antigen
LEHVVKKLFFLALAFLAFPAVSFGQAQAQASRIGDLQVGGGFSIASSDYVPNKIYGPAFYFDFDFREHFGVEGDFHEVSDNSGTQIYERSYEVGGRYLRHYAHGFLAPYVKALYGRGVFNFPQSEANLAYNMFVGGAGVDFRVHPRVNVRVDYEYQDWLSFPPNGLTPQIVTIGAAYHFPAGKPH